MGDALSFQLGEPEIQNTVNSSVKRLLHTDSESNFQHGNGKEFCPHTKSNKSELRDRMGEFCSRYLWLKFFSKNNDFLEDKNKKLRTYCVPWVGHYCWW